MMWASVWLLVRPFLSDAMSVLRVVLLGGGAFLAAWKFGVTPVPVIVVAAAVGFFWSDRE
jgi:hypothetical protein